MRSLINCSVEPHSSLDQPEFLRQLAKLTRDCPTFSFQTDQDTGQTILAAADEHDLRTTLSLLLQSVSFPVNLGTLQIAYRETLIGETEIRYTHKRARDGGYADVRIAFEPIDYNDGFQVETAAERGLIPTEFALGVSRALVRQGEAGVLAGFPVIGVKATLIDARYHDVDSSVQTFEIAAGAAFRELRVTGLARVLEPIVKVVVVTAVEYAEAIEADFRARNAYPIDRHVTSAGAAITAFPSMKNALGYATVLSDLTRNGATSHLQFECYRIVHQDRSPDLFPTAVGMRA